MIKIYTILFCLFISHSGSSLAEDRREEFLSDRPGATDSSKTEQVGRFRVETSALKHTITDQEESNNFGQTFLIYGAGTNTEVQLGFGGFTSKIGRNENARGLANSTLRVKYNILGNYSGDKSLAILPFLTFPTEDGGLDNKTVSGGVNFPFETKLSKDLSLAIMPIWLHQPNEAKSLYVHEFQLPVVLGYSLSEKLTPYIQFIDKISSEEGAKWQGLYGAGAAYLARPNLQIDFEVNSGVTARDEKIILSAGFTYLLK